MPTFPGFLDAMREARGDWTRTDYSVKLPIEEDVIGIASDVHIPFHNERFVADMLYRFADEGVEAICWLGDLLDLPYFSTYDQVDTTTSWQRDRPIAEVIIRSAAEFVPHQYISRGNHDYRALRKAGFQYNMADLMRLIGVGDLLDAGRIIVSDNPTWTYLRGSWLLTHPEQYGSQPLVVPGRMADLEQCNVAAGHAHHWAQGLSPSGRYQVIETGGLFDPRFFEYVQHRPTTARKMCPGYWILKDGNAQGFREAA